MQSPGTRTAFLVGRCPNLQEQPQSELLPLGKGSRNLPNVRSGICWTIRCLCSALTFPALIPHYLAPQNWHLSSPWEQKSCKEPSSKEEEEVCLNPLSFLLRASFLGSGGILRTVRTHPAAGYPCSLWPCALSSPEPFPGIPSCWPPLPLLPPPQHFQLLTPDRSSSGKFTQAECPAVSLGMMVNKAFPILSSSDH